MDRHTLKQTINQVDELIRHGSPSCIRQANSVMVENFNAISRFALELTKPKPEPKRTIADRYPAGGLTATEPCMYCEDFEKLQAENEELQMEIKRRGAERDYLEIKNKQYREALENIADDEHDMDWIKSEAKKIATEALK